MIEAAGLGVAYHAKPKVADAAHARIDHGDLTALLYLQGYARADFADRDARSAARRSTAPAPAPRPRTPRRRSTSRRTRGRNRIPPAQTRTPPARSPPMSATTRGTSSLTNSTCAISGGIEVALPMPSPNSSTPSSSSGTFDARRRDQHQRSANLHRVAHAGDQPPVGAAPASASRPPCGRTCRRRCRCPSRGRPIGCRARAPAANRDA